MRMPFSAAELWKRLHDPDTYPMSGRMCKSVEALPDEDGRAVWIEDIGMSRMRIHDEQTEEPNHLLRSLEDSVVPFSARTEFTIRDEPTGDGCVVTCRNTATVKSGTWHVPFFRVSMRFCGGARSGCKDYLTRMSGGSGSIEWIEESA